MKELLTNNLSDRVINKINDIIFMLEMLFPILYYSLHFIDIYIVKINFNMFMFPYLVLLSIPMILSFTNKKDLKKIINIPNILLLFYILFNIISSINSEIVGISLFGKEGRNEGLVSIIYYVILCIYSQSIVNKKNIKKYINCMIMFANIQVLMAFMQVYLNVIPFFGHSGYGFSGHPNFFGLLMSTISILSLTLYLFDDSNKKEKNFYLISTILCYVGILLAESSGPFFTYCLMLIIIFIYHFIKKVKVDSFIKIIAVLVFLFPIIQMSDYYINKNVYNRKFNNNVPLIYTDILSLAKQYIIPKDNIVNDNNIRDVTTGRTFIWKKCYQIGKNNWLNGIGLDNLEVFKMDKTNTSIFDKCHNNYLDIFVSTGIFSLIVYMLFIMYVVITGIRSNNIISNCLTFSFITYTIAIAMNISTPLVAIYYYIIGGFIISINNNISDFKL